MQHPNLSAPPLPVSPARALRAPGRGSLRVAAGRCLALVVALLALCWAPQGSAAPTDLDEWEQHILQLKSAIIREPSSPNAQLRLAEAYSQIGDTARVEEHCLLALRAGAHSGRVSAQLGEHYLRLARFEQALEHLLRAQGQAEHSGAIHVLMWRALLGMQRSRMAVSPTATAYRQQALGLLSARGYYVPASVRAAGAGLTEDPVTAGSYLAQGYRALRGNDLRQAMLSFQAAADNSPELADAYRGVGIVEARLKHTRRALAAYNLFLSLAPERTRDVEAVERIVLDFYRQAGR